MQIVPYDREKAVSYARQWAFRRNPSFSDFSYLGGNCTNFISQCVYMGSGIMNFRVVFGWYYRSMNDRSPSWTGVEYFNNFLQRKEENSGPLAKEIAVSEVESGDIIQLRFHGKQAFSHSLLVVENQQGRGDILITTNSDDADFRPLSTYVAAEYRALHILGVRK